MQKPAILRHQYQAATMVASDPIVLYRDHIVSPLECAHVIALAQGKMNRAKVSLDEESVEVPGRSGSNCWLDYKEDATLQAIGQRIADIVGIPLENAEHMQVIHYGPDQEYRAHYDAYNLKTARGQRCCKFGGQRMVTALVYLNDVVGGGATAFPNLKAEVTPAPGRMVIFHNVADDPNKPHPDSLHAGTPVTAGEKWAFNIWFRAIAMTEAFDFGALDTQETSPKAPPETSSEKSPQKPGLKVIGNRAQPIIKRALEMMNQDLIKQSGHTWLTYWDHYQNDGPDLSACPNDARLIELLPRDIMNPLANKRLLPRMLADRNLGHLAPASYTSINDAIAHDGPSVPVWFFKNIVGTGGKGMHCVAHEDLGNQVLAPNFVIQAAVPNLHLWQGRKYTTRIYGLIHDGAFRLYDNGFVMIHGPQFDETATDHAIQIDHAGYEKADSAVDVLPLKDHPDYDTWMPRLKTFATALTPVFSDALNASSKDLYGLVGIDLLLQNDGGIQLLEINTAANFVHSTKVNEDVNAPFFKTVFTTILQAQPVTTNTA